MFSRSDFALKAFLTFFKSQLIVGANKQRVQSAPAQFTREHSGVMMATGDNAIICQDI